MSGENNRKFKRYDAFVQLTLIIPASYNEKEFEVTGWVKDVSLEGLALEICVISADEINLLAGFVENKQSVFTMLPCPDDPAVKAKCKILWGKLSNNKTTYNIGLQIVKISPRKKYIWDIFIENMS